MFLANVEFTFNLASLISLIIGLITGAILFVLIYTLITLKSIKKEEVIVNSEIKNITEDDIIKDIEEAKKKFVEQKKFDKEIKFSNLEFTCIELVKKIASRFYPDSDDPVAELTFEELILLDRYIMDKLEEILSKRLLKPFKNLKLSTVLKLLNIKSDVDNNAVVKTAKKYQVNKLINGLYTTLRIANPATWFKKLILNPSINLISKKICFLVIEIIGQETYHVYSKQIFLEPYLDKEMDNLLKLINQDNNEKQKDKELISNK